jgi:hypothetical protein
MRPRSAESFGGFRNREQLETAQVKRKIKKIGKLH